MRLVWCAFVAAFILIGSDAHRKLADDSQDLALPLPDLPSLLPRVTARPAATSLVQEPQESPSGPDDSGVQAEGTSGDTESEQTDAAEPAASPGDASAPASDMDAAEAEAFVMERMAGAPSQEGDEIQVEVVAGAPGPEEYIIYEGDTMAYAPFPEASAPLQFSDSEESSGASQTSEVAAEGEAASDAESGDNTASVKGQEASVLEPANVHKGMSFFSKNSSHTIGTGSKVLPEITLTKEYDGGSYNFSDHKFEKPELPAKPKFTITKIEHIIKPQKPEKSQKKIHITEKKWKDTEVVDKVVKKPPLNVNITIIKDKAKIKPYIIKPELNISVIKFKHDKFTNYAYKPEEKNITVTLIKPEKEKWHKGANKTWLVEKKYKGITVSTQFVEPKIIGGPLYEKFGERYVCYFPGNTPQPSAMKAIKLPAEAAKKLAETSPYSFVAPPPGSTVFGPSCYLYDYKCNYGLGQPCTGHGFCTSEFPNTCTCLFGFKSCTPLGTSYGCETNVNYDTNNCGQCGNQCAAGLICCKGVCLNQTLSDCLRGIGLSPPPPPSPPPAAG